MNPDQTTALPDAAGHARWRLADVEFDETDGSLRVAGKPVVVEPRPLRLLLELLRHAGEVVTKEELQASVWEGRPTVDHVLANAVSKLRTALGEAGAARLITVPRVGYRLAGPVQRMAARAPEVLLQAGQAVPGRDGYLLERALGEGAHSDVWLARHAKLGHAHVFKFASDGPRLSALKREYTLYRVLAQELGPRDDFARVLDTNFVAAPYFIECAFGGQSLLEWAESGGRLATMATQARLDLFVQIARAVAAAHSVGVLHKDLKPGNVLVQAEHVSGDNGNNSNNSNGGERWQARLTDFGSGRLLDLSRLDGLQLTAVGMTQTQSAGADSRSGTLLYMSPELMAGQAPTVQSDVYALGMLLWQMLVGDLRRPLATSWQRELPDDLLQDDVMAATEARSEDRLTSAAELADRVSRLAERRAARDAAQERARLATEAASQLQKARARRPWVVGAVASLAIGLSLSLWFAWQTGAALRRAEQQSARADAVNDFMSEDLLGSLGVATVGKDTTVPMRELLERASRLAGERFGKQPEIEATVRGQLARLYYLLSLFDPAEAEGRRALGLATPDALARDPAMLKIRFDLVRTMAVHNKLPEAKAMLDAVERQADPAQLAASGPVAMSAALARTNVLISGGHAQEALVPAQQVVALSDALTDDRHHARFTARVLLGDLLFRVGRFADADATLATALSQPFDAGNVGVVNMARAQVVRARVQGALGHGAEAEGTLLSARDELVKRLGPGEHYVGVANAELAGLYDQRGDFARATTAYEAALVGFEGRYGAGHPSVRVMRLNLGIAQLNQGQAAQGLKTLTDGRAWFVQYMGGDKGPVVQAIDFERARALSALGHPDQALQLLAPLDAKVLAEASPARDWLWRLQAERANATLRAGRRAEGLALLLPVLQPMADNGTPAWLLASYRALARSSGAAARPAPTAQ